MQEKSFGEKFKQFDIYKKLNKGFLQPTIMGAISKPKIYINFSDCDNNSNNTISGIFRIFQIFPHHYYILIVIRHRRKQPKFKNKRGHHHASNTLFHPKYRHFRFHRGTYIQCRGHFNQKIPRSKWKNNPRRQ